MKQAIYITDQSKDTDGGYIPVIVREGESGFYPLSGRGEFSAPWNWGTDREVAEKIAKEFNERLGLTEEEVEMLVARSMWPE